MEAVHRARLSIVPCRPPAGESSASSRKLGRNSSCSFAAVSEVDLIITDEHARPISFASWRRLVRR
jgi:hypothetical protein